MSALAAQLSVIHLRQFSVPISCRSSGIQRLHLKLIETSVLPDSLPARATASSKLDVQFGKFVADGNPPIESGKLPVPLTNKGNASASFKVHLEAVDAAGNRIDDDTAYAPNLAPGQSTNTYMFDLITSNKLSEMKRATFRIVEVSKY